MGTDIEWLTVLVDVLEALAALLPLLLLLDSIDDLKPEDRERLDKVWKYMTEMLKEGMRFGLFLDSPEVVNAVIA